jgi:transposase
VIAAARVKTDAVDARTLAHLLRADLLPEAYIAPRELRELRELPRHHIALTRLRTALKNRVHALLARQGVQHKRAELFGPTRRAYLGELSLPAPSRRRLESLLGLIADFDHVLQPRSLDELVCACSRGDREPGSRSSIRPWFLPSFRSSFSERGAVGSGDRRLDGRAKCGPGGRPRLLIPTA